MKKSLFFAAVFFAAIVLAAADTRPIVENGIPVQVIYQYRLPGSSAWTTSSATLTDAITEDMMANALAARRSGSEVRIVAVCQRKSRSYQVRYQYSRNGGNWTTASATLRDTPTQTIAGNELARRHSGCQIRIISFVAK